MNEPRLLLAHRDKGFAVARRAQEDLARVNGEEVAEGSVGSGDDPDVGVVGELVAIDHRGSSADGEEGREFALFVVEKVGRRTRGRRTAVGMSGEGEVGGVELYRMRSVT
jgi:hypothetical protein